MKKLLLFGILVLAFNSTSQITLIPDANFELALIDLGYDNGPPDGSVPTANISSVAALNVNFWNINDITGIQDFTSLNYLSCAFNHLTSLDVAQNTALTFLDCQVNNLTFLDVAQNTALTIFSCAENLLTILDVSQNTALTIFSCRNNQLTALNV